MQEFQDFANSHGFSIPNPELDGKIHRFSKGQSKKKNAWYIGWVNHTTSSGKQYVYALVGDWVSGEKFELKPKGKEFSKEDRQLMARQLIESSQKRQKEKEELQEKAAIKASNMWDLLPLKGRCEYLLRKKLSGLHGARTQLEDEGRLIYVPTYDINGKLWGLQRIFPDGAKKFFYGQKTLGTFFQIGELGSNVYICEGYATGASIHEAIGEGVIVAFNANNLTPVAKEFRLKYPQAKIIICGDDDTKVEGNPGRTKAEETAKAVGGTTLFPIGLNDFNDVHVEKGMDALKEQLLNDVAEDRPTGFIPLGFDGGTHYFYCYSTKNVAELTTFTETQILMLADIRYWETLHPKQKGGVDWLAVKNYLIRFSQLAGRYNPDKVRGVGVWKDCGQIVVNTGTKLIHEKKFKPSYVYIDTKNKIPGIHPNPLSVEETKWLRTACEDLKWCEPKFGHLLAGWLAIARLAGALPIRPHIWLTGGSGTGKSTVMDRVVRPALGKGKIYVQGGSTEAGIRQAIKADSIPLIFDEFETLDDNSKQRVTSLIELLRQTWAYTEGSVIKGSSGGAATQYNLCFAALVSSIRVVLNNDADRSRFSVIELAPHGNDRAHWQRFKEVLAHLDEEYGERLFARSIKLLPRIIQSYEVFSDELSGVVSQRFGQQYGMILAGWYSLYSDSPVSPEVAKEVVGDLDFAEHKIDAVITDEIECVNYLATSKVSIYSHANERLEQTVGEIVRGDSKVAIDALKTYGIIIDEQNNHAYIANTHAALKTSIFRNTRWENCWHKSLKRLNGAVSSGAKRFSKDDVHRSIQLPLEYLKM